MVAPVVHFEVHAQDRARAAKFYEDVFGWNTMSMEGAPYTLLFPMGPQNPGEQPSKGIGGGMMDRMGPAPENGQPVNGFVCILEVEDLQASFASVTEHGGTIALEPFDVDGVGRIFYAKDTEGNLFGVLQPFRD